MLSHGTLCSKSRWVPDVHLVDVSVGEDAAIRLGLDFVDVVMEKLVVFDHEFAADVDTVYVALRGNENEVRVGIFEGDAETLRVDKEKIGELAGLERA